MSEPVRREKKIGPYVVGNIIGKGGFGSVYKALDHERGRIVAIKQVGLGGINPGDLGSIEMEISLLSKLKHQNIVKYIDSIRMDHHLNIVLEYVEGGSLASILKKFGAFPETLCAIYTLQIFKGLQYLHDQGVIHRDIKGANVLTTKTGVVKLADFGVAMKLSEVDSSKRRVVGTPYWMAPEIVEMSPATTACDIWSVGSTIVEMITEKPPYADLQQVSALYRIVSDPHPPLPEGISQPLNNFLLLCFEKNHLRRSSARDLLTDEWIVSNKQSTLEITKKLSLTPSRQNQSEEDVARRGSGDNQDQSDEEEEEYVEEVDEENERLSMLVQTIIEGQEAVMEPQNGSGADGSAAVAGGSRVSSKGVANKADPLAPCLAVAEHPTTGSIEGGDEDRPNTNNANPDEGEGTPVGAVVGSHAATGDADCSEREPAITPPAGSAGAAEEESSIGNDTVKNQYHFAFLEYYNKHYEDASDRKPKPLPGVSSMGRRNPSFSNEKPPDEEVAGGVGSRTGDEATDVVRVAESGARDLGAGGSTSPQHASWRGNGDLDGEETPLPPQSPLNEPNVVQHHGARGQQRDAEEIKQLLGSIRPFENAQELVRICTRLMELLQQGSSNEVNNLHLVTQHGAVPIVEMLQVTDPKLLQTVLKVVNQIVEGNQSFQEIFAMVGLIPSVIKFAKPHHTRPLRMEAATFVLRLCHTSARSREMLIACGGLDALVDLVSYDYYHNRDLVWLALDALTKVFDSAPENSQKRDFCRILAKQGLCGHLCLLIDTLASDIHERAAHYLKIVVDLLLFFAKEGDAVVKVYMVKGHVLEGLIAAFEFLRPDLQVQICKTFKNLAQEPSVLNMLENAGVVPVLVHVMSWFCEPAAIAEPPQPQQSSVGDNSNSQGQDACSQCLLALFYLCKLSRPRQEQAALAGVAPMLQELVTRGHHLKQYAFVMLRDMTCASLATRRILWAQGGVAFFVRNLSSPDLPTLALDALVGWLGVHEHRTDWCSRVEDELLKDKMFLDKLLVLFKASNPANFMKILLPLLNLVKKSPKISVAIAGSEEFFTELVRRIRSASHIRGASADAPDGVSTYIESADPEHPVATVDLTEKSPMAASRIESTENMSSVRRLASEPAMLGSDDVRARTDLMKLLHTLCEAQERTQLAMLCQRYRLQILMQEVFREERRHSRVILCEIASKLLELFEEASLADATPKVRLDNAIEAADATAKVLSTEVVPSILVNA